MLSLYAIASAGMAAQRPVGRRAVLGAAMSPALAPALAPARAAGPAYTIERVIPLAELTGGIASSRVRNIVITGANSGVGLAGAKQLVAAGHRVVCACRTQAKADAAAAAALDAASAAPTRPGGTAVGAECDLADMGSIRQFATRMAKGGPIDTLVLNAGVAMNQADKAPRRTADGFELTIGTNHLGHFLLANLLLTTVAASPSPRIVVTASPVHDPASGGGDVGAPATLGALKGLSAGPGFDMVDGGPYDADKAYKDSKLCNMLFTAEASRRWAKPGVSVNAFSPGLIADPDGFFRYQNRIFSRGFDAITRAVGVAETSQFGGSALGYLAADAALDKVSGAWYDTYPPGKHQLAVHDSSAEARDVQKAAELWRLSAELTRV